MANLTQPTNNLMSNIMLQSRHPVPEVGMGATVCFDSDRSACTIVAIRHFKGGKRKGQVSEVDVQDDEAIRTDKNGMSDAQSYEYHRDPNGRIQTFKVRKDGSFGNLLIGHRAQFHNYSF